MTATRADVLTEKPRIASLDIMRGVVMVIMALDHARDFFHADAFVYDPTNLERTTPAVFFTRFITHFCAPTFVLLSGTAVRISQQRKSKKELSMFLLTRGLWLVFLEITVVRFSMLFQLYYDVTIFQVIWAIGFSMVLLSLLIRLPLKGILALGFLIVFGHDLLHNINLQTHDPVLVVWTFVHQAGFIELHEGKFALVPYPFLPWLGIMLLGYCMGEWFQNGFDHRKRKRMLIATGIGAVMLFLILRSFDVYGDPSPWMQQKNFTYSVMSFLNVTKYPVSLQYTLITLGPIVILLAYLENVRSAVWRPFTIFGRVPLFYYVLHFYLLHLGALILYMANSRKNLAEIDFHFNAGFGGLPPGYGYPLAAAYVAWISVVVMLYPLCKAYDRYKSRHKQPWLSYL